MIAARSTFVFSKAHALAKRIPHERDKKHAAHTVCERLLALLALRDSPPPSQIKMRREFERGCNPAATQEMPGKRYSPPPPLAGNPHRDLSLGCGFSKSVNWRGYADGEN